MTLTTALFWTIGLMGQVLTTGTQAMSTRHPAVHERPSGPGRRPDERGLSQSTENAILLAGAVAVAGIVVAVITVYVRNKLPQ
ncbi:MULTISPECIES: hypothetical protein [Aestuariimicrobium]|uniref:hypothetical protein n=1 Tax=Aestuariimicrobium TaxID=396388 RepID=UPI00040F94DA|nr:MULTISPECIES: hypothetical protein [Aestuariimicrobium]CAI9403349.1 hypothetical protein AESSP_00986 [Aestuariimicrobium sp. T2.26MG-19.2B]